MPEPAPAVSVIIPAYNAADFIGQAIASVLGQTFADFELIVVDDGSTDGMGAVVAQFQDERLGYVYQRNRERSAARNTGIRLARGEFIAFLDADDRWLPQKLARQVARLRANPQVGLVYVGGFVEEDGRVFFEQKCRFRGDVLGPLLTEDNIVTGSASSAIVRRECFAKVGLFDEQSSVCEDWEMWIRIARHYPFDFVPEPLVRLRVHGGNTQKQAARMAAGTERFFARLLANPSLAPAVAPVRSQVLGLSQFMQGRAYYFGRDLPRARGHFWRAIRHTPTRWQFWQYFLRSFLGQGQTETLRAWRNQAQNFLRYRNR